MNVSGPLVSSPSGPSVNVSGTLVNSPSGPSVNVSGPLVSSPSGPSVNVSGPLVSSPSGPSVNVSGPLVSSPSGLCTAGPLMNLPGPQMSSSSALNVSSPLVSSPSGPQQLVHIPFSPRLPSDLPSRKRSPLSNLLNIPMQSEIPRKTGKARVLTSAECVQALKDKEKKKQEEAEQKAKRLEERLKKKKQKEEEFHRKKEETARKKAEREAARVEKEAAKLEAKTKGDTAKLPVPVKRRLRDGKESCKKRSRVDSSVFTDLCCVCFGSYQEDAGTERQWLQCNFQRWIHEDCIDYNDSNISEGL